MSLPFHAKGRVETRSGPRLGYTTVRRPSETRHQPHHPPCVGSCYHDQLGMSLGSIVTRGPRDPAKNSSYMFHAQLVLVLIRKEDTGMYRG
jgi:hypothetical protein